jgi:hypothetical protein
VKIGILTFHCAHNYGAVLQAYGLKEVLKSLGHSVEIIDYRPKYFANKYNPFAFQNSSFYDFLRSVLGKYRIIPTLFWQLKRNIGFNNYINRVLKPVRIDLEKTDNEFDVFIVGSDQIWNPNITGKCFDKVYFGEFKASSKKKIVAYAASAGGYTFSVEEMKQLKELFSKFHRISVREETLKDKFSCLGVGAVEQVLDPVLLATGDVFKKISNHVVRKGKYVLVYQVVVDPETMRIAKDIAMKLDADVVELTAKVSFSFSFHKDQSAPPNKFIGYFNNAEFIVTTSYHGMVFSILFGKPFYVVSLDSNHDNRSRSLLISLGLEDRLIPKFLYPKSLKIDYTLTNMKLDKLRQNSLDFLVGALDDK